MQCFTNDQVWSFGLGATVGWCVLCFLHGMWQGYLETKRKGLR
jgi:hypothetical protein